MKKLAKPLILLLVVSLLAGAFIVGALAEDTTSTGAVGSYTQPDGSWTVPTEDDPDTEADETAIVFGVWAAEADFLAGEAPDHWYTDGEFTGARIGTTDNNGTTYGVEGFIPGYVHCFGDVTNSTAQIPTGQQQTLVINLAGHTFTNAKGFRIGGASGAKTNANVTFENGTINHTAGQIQARGNSTIKYDNVVYNHTQTPIVDDDGRSYLEFKNSEVNTASAKTVFNINANSNSVDSTIKFINTDVVCTATQTETLFRITSPAGNKQTKTATVVFDKDSSLTRSSASAPLVALNYAWYDNASVDTDGDGIFGWFEAVQYVNFELGFKYSESTIPTTFTYQHYNMSSGRYSTVATSEERAVGAENYLVVNVLDGEETVTDYVMFLTDSGMYELIKAPTAETAWTPEKEGNTKDYTGITYGVWASEAHYLLGYEPTSFSTSDVLDTALIGATDVSGGVTYADPDFIPGYVHLYANVSNTADVIIGRVQKLTINLGGKTWTQSTRLQIGGPSGVSLPESSLTVKNGNWISSAQLQARIDTTLILEDVNLTKSTYEFFFEYGAGYVKLTDCTVTTATAVFWFNQTNAKRTQLIFENTDLVYTGAPGALFQFNKDTNAIDISFDADSSVQGNVTTWYTVKDGVTLNDGAVEITFADGVSLSEGIVLPTVDEAYTGKITVTSGNVNTICSSHTAGDAVVSDVVEATCTTGGSYTSTVSCTACGTVISSGNVETPANGHAFGKDASGADIACTVCGTAPYQPAEGTTYVVWATELDYLTGKDPVAVYSDTILTEAAIGTTDAYVHVYADITTATTETKILGPNQNLVINLAGNTLTQKGKIRVGDNSVSSYPNVCLTIKNGTWTRTSGQLQLRKDVTVIVENVVFNNNVGNLFTSGWAANLIKFKDCTIYATANGFKNTDASEGVDTVRGQFILENTDIIFSGDNTAAFFNFTGANSLYDFYFDGNSSIKGNVYAWYSVNDGVTLNEGAVTFTFADGFTLDAGVALPENATGVTVTAGEINYICEIHSFGKDENGDTACTVCGTEPFKPEAGTTYIIWSTGLDYIKGIAPYRVSTDAEITGNADNNYILDDIPNGAIIVLYENISMGTAHTYSDYSLTIDLNGHKLTLTGTTNMQLGYSGSSSWKERVITFTSSNGRGTIDATKRTSNTFQARPGSIVLFENLDITFGGNGFNDGGAKSITFRNCNVTGRSGYHIGATDGGLTGYLAEERTYTFDNTTVTGMGLHKNWYREMTNVVVVNVVNGCVIDNSASVVNVTHAGRTITLNIDIDTKFTSFNSEFYTTVEGSTVTLNILDGETTVTDYAVWSSGEYYVIGEKTAVTGFSANLTLYSDFNLNFFGAENIVGVYYNGNLLESMSYEAKTKYTLKGITPDTAAETLKFIVAVKVGEETCYMPLNYSVLKYAETVVGDGTAVNAGTQLVSAVMNYVKAAYVYTGKDAPAFTGVAYDVAVTAPETGFAHSAISGVQLELGTEIGVRFNLSAGDYTVKIGDATYQVVDGKVGEVDYVVVNMRAYQFANGGITVVNTDTNELAIYTLADYVAYANGTEDANLAALVTALYEYSYLANEYKNN